MLSDKGIFATMDKVSNNFGDTVQHNYINTIFVLGMPSSVFKIFTNIQLIDSTQLETQQASRMGGHWI